MTAEAKQTTNRVYGDLKALSLFEVTHSLTTGRKSAEVLVQDGEKKAYLYFRNGQIISALDPDLRKGEQAAATIFGWKQGSFTIDFEKELPEPSIETPTDYLLLDVARNLDEVRADAGVAEDEDDAEITAIIEGEVQARIDRALRTRLNTVFKDVALNVAPTRARYTPDAFDAHLAALVQHQGSALVVAEDRRPRVRAQQGFQILQDERVTGDEIAGFLTAVLSERESDELLTSGEVTGFHTVANLGSFRLHVVRNHGRHLMLFSQGVREVPQLEDLLADEGLERRLTGLQRGLILIGGPLGCGKGTFTAALVQRLVQARGAFAITFSGSEAHRFESEVGFCVNRSLPPSGGVHGALRTALGHEPDILAISGGSDLAALREAFLVGLGAAGGERLVIYSLDSHSPNDTVTRLFRLAQTLDGDPLWESVAEVLALIVDLAPGHSSEPRVMSTLTPDSQVRRAFCEGDLDAVKTRRLISPR